MKKIPFLLSVFCTSLVIFGCEKQDLSSIPEPLDTDNLIYQEGAQDAELIFESPKNNSDEVLGKTPVTFLWNKPVFTLQNTKTSQKALERIVKITPDIKGSWQQLGTTGILFEPRENWTPSTRYTFTLPFGKQAYTFETSRLKIQHLESNLLIADAPLKVIFNQEFPIEEAKKIQLSPETPFNVRHEEVEQEDGTKKIDRSRLLIIPKNEWPAATDYTLTLPTETAGLGGLKTTEAQVHTFRTIDPFTVQNFSAPKNVTESISFTLSAEVSPKEFIENLSIEPLEKEVWEEYKANFLEETGDYTSSYLWLPPVKGLWKPGQTYTLTLSEDIKDTFKRSLEKEQTFTFTAYYPNEVKRVFFPSEWKNYQTGTFPEYSLRHSGDIKNPSLTFERLWPEPFVQNINLEWKNLPETQNVHTFNFAEQFKENLQDKPQGIFRVKLDYQAITPYSDQMQAQNIESLFSVGDFLLESKKEADGATKLFAKTYEYEPLSIDESFQVQQNWGEKGATHTFESFSGGVIPAKNDPYQNILAVMARSGDKIGITSIESSDISPYDLAVSFSPWNYQQSIRSVGFSDRPLYRPGDTIEFAALFRELQMKGKNFPLKNVDPQKSLPYQMIIRNPQYEEVLNQKGTTQSGNLSGSWEIPLSSTLGAYHIELQYLGSKPDEILETTSIQFYVTEYRKPDFLIEANFQDNPVLWKEKTSVEIQANYAFGGALSGKKVQYTLSLFGYKPSDWWWRIPERRNKLILQGEGVLNNQGKLTIPFDLTIDLKTEEEETDVLWDLVTLDATVFASESEPSSINLSVPFFLGSEKIELDPSDYFYETADDQIPFSGKITDLEGNALKSNGKAELLRKKWARNDRKDPQGEFIGEWHWIEEVIDTQKISTEKDGMFSGNFERPESAGQYVLRVTSVDGKNRESRAENNFYIWTAERDPYALRQNELNNILPIFANQTEFKVGENATILFPHTEWEIRRAHITLERGEVLEVLEGADLENQVVSFPIESWMAPNVMVSVLLEGTDAEGQHKVKWGVINILVKDPERSLMIDITPDKESYKPGEIAQLKIKTTVNQKAVSAKVTLAVVDQTLLALRTRQDINLAEIFLSQLPLGVKTSHTATDLLSTQELKNIYDQVKNIQAAVESPFGGGGAKGMEMAADSANVDKPRGDFRDTAAWETWVETDENGEITLSIPLPDNLTTWNIWALGSTDQNAFGEGRGSFQTTLPLLISPITPNFFRYGDKTQIGLLIRRNLPDQPSENTTVKIKVESKEAGISFEEEKTVRITDEERVFFDIEIPYDKAAFKNENQNVSLTFEIQTQTSELKDSVVLERKLVPPVIVATAADLKRVSEPGSTQVIAGQKALSSLLNIKVFGSLLEKLETFVDKTQTFNYGGSEQEMTYWATRILQNKLFTSLGKETLPIEQTEQSKAIASILQSQDENGGFRFWKNNFSFRTQPNSWVTAHILEFAPQFPSGSFPQESLDRARVWLREQVLQSNCKEGAENKEICSDLDDTTRQYAAYVLLRDKSLQKSDLEFLSDYTNTSLESKVWFAFSVQMAGKETVSPKARTRLTAIEENIERSLKARDRFVFWEETEKSFFSQNQRLTALIFSLWLDADRRPDLHDSIARYLAQNHKNVSGNSALHVLSALQKYQQNLPTSNFPAEFALTLTPESEQANINGSITKALESQNFTKELTPGETYQVSHSSTNAKEYFVETELQEIYEAQDIEGVNHGFWIERNIYALDDTQYEFPLTTLRVGENYIVRLQVITNTSHEQVVVEDSIISGTEAVNFDLENENQSLNPDRVQEGAIQPWECFGWCQPFISHKEFAFDKARFFVESMPEGVHEFKYILRARVKGTYEQSPAQVFEMYNPEVMTLGNGRVLKVE